MATALSISTFPGGGGEGAISNLFGFSKSNLIPSSLCHSRSFKIRMVQNEPYSSYWANIQADIQKYLKNAIPIRHPISVFEPMHHLTFAAPKTTAPALCIAACELLGGDRDQAMAAAAAIHLVHAAAYAHQHLPSLTDRPTPKYPTFIKHLHNPNIELLTGDSIMPFGIELLAESAMRNNINADRVLRVIIEITRATGARGEVEYGRYRERDILNNAECTSSDDDDDDVGLRIECVCKKKEGELHGCAAACGGILGGASEEEIEKLRMYGVYAGMVKGTWMLHYYHQTETGGLQQLQEVVEKMRGLAIKELESLKNISGQVGHGYLAGLVNY